MGLKKLTNIAFLTYGLPILVMLSAIGIGLSPLLQKYPELIIGITYDLTLTAPLLFLVLAVKSNVPKIRAIPIFILGTIIASYILPINDQHHLILIRTYALPIVEVTAFVIVVLNMLKVIKKFKSIDNNDFYFVAKKSGEELFGKSKFGAFMTSEITMFYYAVFSWKRRKAKANEFTNYKESGSIALSGGIIMVVLIETFVIHTLLIEWSVITAWIFTISSLYTALLIFAHIKALLKRPSILTEHQLVLKNGLLADIFINLSEIEKIEYCNKELHHEKLRVGNLELPKESTDHTIALYFNSPQTIEKMYGFTEECDILLLQIDNRHRFLEEVKEAINKSPK
ncbi:MAG: hypothetical protein COA50_03760 [Flavobacteriaceae bacterium]|nr:MAG: hypothetical protein COA50_03760 [Flavobacteriaceae bacterium]